MMGVDKLLAERAIQGDPVRVAMAGCGFIGHGLVNQIVNSVPGMTEDFHAITQTDGIDVVIDVTGSVERGCHLALGCFAGGKHLVLMNAELDATVGAELGRLADAAGVVLTGCDGDQPGLQMNLIRFVRSIGFTPLVSGNVKGFHDTSRNPTTQEGLRGAGDRSHGWSLASSTAPR
jgi:predicted homoserine dehydrogenase-like protein